jgi:disulfide bond formation protein DsbB
MLATAHAFERFGGYAPCLLCLKQREVYWVAAGVALVSLAALRLPGLRALRPWMGLALGLIFLFGAGLAAFHAGVEWKWWPGPAACASGGGSVAGLDMSGLVDGSLKVRPPSCEDAAWRLAGLSMAGWNALASLGLAAAGVAAWRAGRARA